MRLWTETTWRASALGWADRELRGLGHHIQGEPVQFHVRPWSTLFRIATDHGDVYLKAVPPELAHEIRLTSWLGDRHPDRVLRVLAADPELGLMLLPDGGTRLREAGVDARGWERLVREYAELQLLVAPRAPELLAVGVPDRRLASLPQALATVMPEPRSLVERYAALCSELAQVGVPETLQMDDLHDGNVFTDGQRFCVFDWGDASIAHPFVSLGMILGTYARRTGLARDDTAVRCLRDAYLRPFTRIASLDVLRDAATLAERVAPTVRILAWQVAHHSSTPEERSGEGGETLEELIDQQRAALV